MVVTGQSLVITSPSHGLTGDARLCANSEGYGNIPSLFFFQYFCPVFFLEIDIVIKA